MAEWRLSTRKKKRYDAQRHRTGIADIGLDERGEGRGGGERGGYKNEAGEGKKGRELRSEKGVGESAGSWDGG